MRRDCAQVLVTRSVEPNHLLGKASDLDCGTSCVALRQNLHSIVTQ